jgi:hypothetical protein
VKSGGENRRKIGRKNSWVERMDCSTIKGEIMK